MQGSGQPVDDIDRSCKRQYQCYECAKMDYPTRNCDSSRVQYQYQLTFDTADPNNHAKKGITCTDPWGGPKTSCRRAICECDKKVAEDLRENFAVWDISKHKDQGGFDASTGCPSGSGTGGSSTGDMKCCGDYPTRFPYQHSTSRDCCVGKTYNTGLQKCCNGQVMAFGAC